MSSRGFTFLEVLFAVIIIGVGVIMIAGVFPVAIEQTQVNLAESAAIPLGRDALRAIQEVANTYVPPAVAVAGVPTFLTFPATYNPTATPAASITSYPVMPIPNTIVTNGATSYAYSNLIYPSAAPSTAAPYKDLANPLVVAVSGSQIPTGDRRYAWLAFYRRDLIQTNGVVTASPYAQVWVITAQSTIEGQPTYSVPPLTGPTSITDNPNHIVGATLNNTGGVSTIAFAPNSGPAVANAYVLVLSDVPTAASGLPTSGTLDPNLIGQVLRLGTQTVGSNTWSLIPGSDLSSTDTLLAGGPYVTVFVLGAAMDPTTGQYTGPAQDLTCTTGFIRVSN